MNIFITGGGWITADKFSCLSDTGNLKLSGKTPVIKTDADIFPKQLPRYGRFDNFTKLGCTAAALAFKDAGLKKTGKEITAGMVISTTYEVMEMDINFYQTTIEEGGIFSSPNLFSYTLPATVLGECAVLFDLTGPTFCVGGGEDEIGFPALEQAAVMIAAGKANRMFAGWIECPPRSSFNDDRHNDVKKGSVFVILEKEPEQKITDGRTITYEDGFITGYNGKVINSLTDLFISERLKRRAGIKL